MIFSTVFILLCLYVSRFVNGTRLPETRIIGGEDAQQSDFQFLASIRTSNNDYLCSGTIIDSYWVITAAECVFGKPNNTLFVFTGSVTLSGGGSLYMVKEVILHPSFNPVSKENNVALIKVANRIIFNDYVDSIPLAENVIGNGKTVELSGWGATEKFSFTDILQVVELKSLTFENCKPKIPETYSLYAYNICSEGVSKGACIGDIGSPLIQRAGIIFGKTELHGIVSQYQHCGNGYPDVYIAIAPFKAWIDQMLGI